jgi:hypothetical protein
VREAERLAQALGHDGSACLRPTGGWGKSNGGLIVVAGSA